MHAHYLLWKHKTTTSTIVVDVVFTKKRSFYPTTPAVHPVSIFVLHREIQSRWVPGKRPQHAKIKYGNKRNKRDYEMRPGCPKSISTPHTRRVIQLQSSRHGAGHLTPSLPLNSVLTCFENRTQGAMDTRDGAQPSIPSSIKPNTHGTVESRLSLLYKTQHWGQ